MELKEKFTLIVPTYNRYPYLLRLLKYYKSFQFPFSIYILDSSSEELEIDDLKQLLKDKSIIYEKFNPNIFFPNKIAMGCNYVTTPYVALCADDDFIVPSGIEDSVRFLINELDYTLAHGRYTFHRLYSAGKKLVWEPGYFKDKTLANENTLDRINAHLSSYSSTFYAVHRTEIMKLIWNETAIHATSFGLSEILPSVLSVLYGKLKVLDVFYSSREQNNFLWYDSSFHSIMYSAEKIAKASDVLATHISQKEGLSLDASKILARKCMENYINPLFQDKGHGQFVIYQIAKSLFGFPLLRRVLKSFRRIRLLHRLILSINKISYSRKLENFRKELIKIKESVINSNLDNELLNKTRKTYKNFVKDD